MCWPKFQHKEKAVRVTVKLFCGSCTGEKSSYFSLEVVDFAICRFDVFHVVDVLLLDAVSSLAHEVVTASFAESVPHEVRNDRCLVVVAKVHWSENVLSWGLEESGQTGRDWLSWGVFSLPLGLQHFVEPDRLELLGGELHELTDEWSLVGVEFGFWVVWSLAKIEQLGEGLWDEALDRLDALLAEVIGGGAAAQQVEDHVGLVGVELLGVGVLVGLEVVASLSWVALVLDEPLWSTVGFDITETWSEVTLGDS